jgi:DNA polymerase-3 subunit epsilon
MELQLERDIVFFDIEATGLNVLKDRIIQIALIKHHADDSPVEELEFMINPEMEIAPDAIKVHGITSDMLADKPTFNQVADELYAFIGDADLAGYNSDRFDIPMLLEEFARVGYDLDLSLRRCLDVQKIFYKMEPRTLKAAYRVYCDAELENAHDAMADVKATVAVFKGQLDKYDGVDYIDGDGFNHGPPIVNDVSKIVEFTSSGNSVDVTNRLKYNPDGEIVFNFGKHIGKRVKDVISKDKQYYNWILDKDFSVQVKQTLRKLMAEIQAGS